MAKLRSTALLALVMLAASPAVLVAQLDFVITTVAGSSYAFAGDGGPATAAQLSQMYHVLCDPQGNVLVADRTNHLVVRITPSGTLRVIAGNGIPGLSGDGGPATRASLSFPSALALDTAGNLYITDAGNYLLRRVDRDGVIETIAGTVAVVTDSGGPWLSASPPAGRALPGQPLTLAVTPGEGTRSLTAMGVPPRKRASSARHRSSRTPPPRRGGFHADFKLHRGKGRSSDSPAEPLGNLVESCLPAAAVQILGPARLRIQSRPRWQRAAYVRKRRCSP